MIPSKQEDYNYWHLPLTISGIVFLVLGAILTLTNPSQKQYEEFATEQLVIYLKENVCKQKSANLGEALKSQICNLMVDTGKKQVPQVVAQTTDHHNYLLLSVYETQLYIYSFQTIGIFNNFYVVGVDKIYDH